MSPHFDRHTGSSGSAIAPSELGGEPEDDAMDIAAEALRQVEVEAVHPDVSGNDSEQLENMSIDDLRKLAAKLDVPDRATITETDELIAAIRQRL